MPAMQGLQPMYVCYREIRLSNSMHLIVPATILERESAFVELVKFIPSGRKLEFN